jgi:hypothetical protein
VIVRVTTLYGLVLATACITPPNTYPEPKPVIIAAPRDAVWPAIVESAGSYGLVVSTIDRGSGIVQSGRMLAPSDTNDWDCGYSTAYEGPMIHPVLVVLTITAVPFGRDSTRLRATANPGLPRLGTTEKYQCVSKGQLEARIIRSILDAWTQLRR